MINSEKDLISIIMSVFNVENYLERSLNSIINQTYKNWELIAVNDGSTDCSKIILDNYSKKDSRIIVLNQENQGQSVARNKAIALAKGQYICFFDSDDYVEANIIEKLLDAAVKTEKDIAMCSYFISTENTDKIAISYDKKITLKEFKSKLIKNEIQSFLWDKIFKKYLFDNISIKKGVYFEDMLVYDELLPKISKGINIINKPLYHYYQRDNSSVHVRKLSREKNYFDALKHRFELDYINNEEKAYCLKYMLISFYYFYQINDLDYKILNDCINYINNVPNYLLSKAKKLLTPKELIRFLLAYNCPFIYKLIFKFYSILKNINVKLASLRK